jgi:hypothetical protein
MAPSAALLAAYRRTAYEAGGVVVRVGRRSAAMDALLAGRSAAFVTAWNPFSRPMPRGWNERMQDRLREAASGRVVAQGWGGAGRWREAHLLLAGDPRALAVLARRFRQHAILAVAPRQAARLVFASRLTRPDARR